MVGTVYIKGEIGVDVELMDVVRQVKAFGDDVDTLVFDIHSVGGYITEGEAIYNYMQGLKSEFQVNTRTDMAFSMAAHLFMAGENREVVEGEDRIMIHFAWAKDVSGKAEDFETLAASLRETEKEFADFYADALGLDSVTVSRFLDNDTFINSTEALELGFATKVVSEKIKAIAKYDLNQNSNKMSDKKKKSLMSQFLAWAEKNTGSEIVALTLQDSNGDDIVFDALDEDATPDVGDTAKLGDVAIPDGSYIMPSLEGTTVVFVDGAISEIIPKADESGEDSGDAAESIAAKGKKAKEKTVAETIKEVSVWSVEVVNSSFAVGEVVMYNYEDGEHPVMAGEFRLPDGRTIVTNASGEIVTISEESSIDDNDEDVDVAAMLDSMVARVTETVKKEGAEQIKELKAQLKAVKALVKSDELDTDEEVENEMAGAKKNEGGYMARIMRAQAKK